MINGSQKRWIQKEFALNASVIGYLAKSSLLTNDMSMYNWRAVINEITSLYTCTNKGLILTPGLGSQRFLKPTPELTFEKRRLWLLTPVSTFEKRRLQLPTLESTFQIADSDSRLWSRIFKLPPPFQFNQLRLWLWLQLPNHHFYSTNSFLLTVSE